MRIHVATIISSHRFRLRPQNFMDVFQKNCEKSLDNPQWEVLHDLLSVCENLIDTATSLLFFIIRHYGLAGKILVGHMID